jgi:glycine oxidase
MSPEPPVDVLVVGGGVIGLSVAWRAAASGRAVTVVDPAPGRGASWAAGGMLAPVAEAHFGEEALTGLLVRAAPAWPGFARDLEEASGRLVHYRADGALLVAFDPSDRAATEDVLGFQLALGLAARRLSARECRSSEPLLSPGIRGGADLPGDHQVDNRLVVEALLVACERAGVTFVSDRAEGVATEGGRVTGVSLAGGGSRTAGAVIVAAGCESGQVTGLNVQPPVRPVKGMTLRLQAPPDAPRLRRTVRALVHGRNCYLVPRDGGGVVVGATVEEKGFDLAVQVGAVSDLLDAARELVPALDEYTLTDTTTGLRPGSPDNAPLVGPTGVAGLIVATGHHRNGILLAPATADEVVRLLGGGAPSDLFAAFGPERFGTAGGARSAGGPAAAASRTPG